VIQTLILQKGTPATACWEI